MMQHAEKVGKIRILFWFMLLLATQQDGKAARVHSK
jgi:hypothetical protein